MISRVAAGFIEAGNQPTDPAIDVDTERLLLQLFNMALEKNQWKKSVTLNSDADSRRDVRHYVPEPRSGQALTDTELAALEQLVKSRTEGVKSGYTISYQRYEGGPEQKLVIDSAPIAASALSVMLLAASQVINREAQYKTPGSSAQLANRLQIFADAFERLAIPMLRRGALLDKDTRETFSDVFTAVKECVDVLATDHIHIPPEPLSTIQAVGRQLDTMSPAVTQEWSRSA